MNDIRTSRKRGVYGGSAINLFAQTVLAGRTPARTPARTALQNLEKDIREVVR